jgi:hydroxymethylpyrimidine/phosphomethylpyrimidine kinase
MAIYDSEPVQTSQIKSGQSAGVPTDRQVVVAVIGGLDPSGGAGLIRDVLTAMALGARPLAVGTAWTEQAEGRHRVEPRRPADLADAVRQAVAGGPDAIKIGMVPDPTSVEAILAGLGGYPGPVVVDPVMATSRGGSLWRGAPEDLLPLLRRATLVTPNAGEAAALSGQPVRNLQEAAAGALALRVLGLPAVLVKGGHLGTASDPVTDTLVTEAGVHRSSHARVPGGDVRGTGCALATALAVHLARGASMMAALEAATEWLTAALAAAVDVGDERHLP